MQETRTPLGLLLLGRPKRGFITRALIDIKSTRELQLRAETRVRKRTRLHLGNGFLRFRGISSTDLRKAATANQQRF